MKVRSAITEKKSFSVKEIKAKNFPIAFLHIFSELFAKFLSASSRPTCLFRGMFYSTRRQLASVEFSLSEATSGKLPSSTAARHTKVLLAFVWFIVGSHTVKTGI